MKQAFIGLVCVGSSLSLGTACHESESTSTPPDASADETNTAAPAHCAEDPAVPARDAAAPGSCTAARYFLTCSVSGGGGALCLSDDPTRCDTGTIATAACTSRCAANEYAVTCGGPPSRVDGGDEVVEQEAPKSCRNVGTVPSGAAFYCCPCE